MTRHRQVADDLKRRIAHREYLPGDLMPSVEDLMSTYSVPDLVIRQALQELADAAVVQTRNGVGTFVLLPDTVHTPEPDGLAELRGIRAMLDKAIARLEKLDTTASRPAPTALPGSLAG